MKQSSFDATISALVAETSAFGAATSAIARSPAGVFGLIECQYPSPGLALPIFFNNNNNSAIAAY